jgi:hypothetical protein
LRWRFSLDPRRTRKPRSTIICPTAYCERYLPRGVGTCHYCPIQTLPWGVGTCHYCPIQTLSWGVGACHYCPIQTLSWGVGTCHYCPIQTLGTPNWLGTQGVYEHSRQPNVQIWRHTRDSRGHTSGRWRRAGPPCGPVAFAGLEFLDIRILKAPNMEHVNESGVTWVSRRAKGHCDRALGSLNSFAPPMYNVSGTPVER